MKRGTTVIVKNARRTDTKREGGQGFVVLGSLGALAGDGEGGGDGSGGGKGRGKGKGLARGGDGGEEEGEGKNRSEGDDDGDGGGGEEGGRLMGVVPAPLEMTKSMLEVLRQRDEASASGEEREEKKCDGKFDGCITPGGREGDGKGLKRCQGCLEVWYCSKVRFSLFQS